MNWIGFGRELWPNGCTIPAITWRQVVVGRDSSVGIATRYGLDGSGDRFTMGARFFAAVQTGPGAHPASYTMGTGSLPRGYSGRGVELTTHPHLVPRLKKEYSYTCTPLWAFMACSRENFTFTLPQVVSIPHEITRLTAW
jgi:hypothetical protein